MRLFWKHDGEMFVVDGVPAEAVPFAIGSCCPCGGGVITWICREPRAYACTTSDWRVKNRHVGWPKLTYRIDDDNRALLVTDNELDLSSEFMWKPYRSGSSPSSE